jgi:acetyl-CoA synthetase
LIYAATTFKYVFDYHPSDIYWCTADVGWITGHTYVVYGPLANGATSIVVCSAPRSERIELLERGAFAP